jgi:primary-amine oxidase
MAVVAMGAGFGLGAFPASASAAAAPGGEAQAAAVSAAAPAAAATVGHPLDPLSAEEIRAAVAIVKADARLTGAAFPVIAIAEPPKADVLAWTSGRPFTRQARIVATVGHRLFELLVDLDARRLSSVVERPGAEAPITGGEVASVSVVLQNPEFQAALKKRGITDVEKVFCAPFSAGYYGIPEHEGKRIVKVGCFDTRRSTTNVFGWPIERLYAIVDLRERKVLSVTDGGVVPIADGDRNYTEAAVGALRDARKPTAIAQPQGANVRIDGHEVTWGNWRFHARIDGRVGTVIELARWQTTAAAAGASGAAGAPGGGGPAAARAARPVLYQGYLSEMFVPYMDADYGWFSRTYFDTGEYGAGLLTSSLKPGIDCPATASFLPATFHDEKGEPFTTPNALCIFERSLGEPIWRHAEAVNQTYEGRANVELVVRMATAIGNYDYLFDWVFNDAAEIEVRVGATGIDALKGVAARSMTDTSAAEDTRYGTLVAPNLVAVNHDHYFNFRLDLDVDGAANSFNQDVYRQVALPAGSPRRTMYVVEPHVAETEKAAQIDTGRGHEPGVGPGRGEAQGPVKFRVINESRKNAVGNAASYEILFANHARLLLDPEDWPAKRARFLQHDVWVTPFDPAERYAAGDYVFESKTAGGLPAWTARDRAIRNKDIVVWVNLGMHHLTRAEDLPVMPTIWHSFKLRPHNFFDRNPAIDLRTEPAPASNP